LGELPLIICFRSHIGQVLTNLFANAADALEERVSAERAEGKIFRGQIRVQSYMAERDGVAGVCVAVSDNGLGVEEALRQQIFEAFVTTKPSGVGTGLGLSVCATIAADHGGIIRVEDDEQLGGARFVMWLPIIMVQEDQGVEHS
jgi:signal transduction histidine kinase